MDGSLLSQEEFAKYWLCADIGLDFCFEILRVGCWAKIAFHLINLGHAFLEKNKNLAMLLGATVDVP